MTTNKTTNKDWGKVQADLRAGAYGPWECIREMLCNQASAAHPGNGISSSDVNHMAYGWALARRPLSPEAKDYAERLWADGWLSACCDVITVATAIFDPTGPE